MITLETALKSVGHSCREKEFTRIAGELGLSAPWTQEDVDAIRAARTFNPGVAAKKARPSMCMPEFLDEAAKLGLPGPRYTMSEIHQVRDAVTDDWQGMTSDDIAERLGVIDVEWVRRTARKHSIGEWAKTGCYMHKGKRIRRPSKSRSFSEADVARLRDKLPDSAFARKVTVSEDVYQTARAMGSPDAVIKDWIANGAEASLSG